MKPRSKGEKDYRRVNDFLNLGFFQSWLLAVSLLQCHDLLKSENFHYYQRRNQPC